MRGRLTAGRQVLVRSRPAFQLVPVDDTPRAVDDLERDPIYRAKPLGRSTGGPSAADHDSVLYGK